MRGFSSGVSSMSASPFQTTLKPFLEVASPVAPSELSERRPLEDVPFESTIENFPIPAEKERERSQPQVSWFARFFASRTARNRREEVLENELRDLRASYAALLHSTEDIRERLDAEEESRQTVQRALSPFPAAVAGLENIRTRQEEAGEILLNIRERMETTADRDEEVMASLGFLNGGVKDLQSGVTQVSEVVQEVAQGQSEMSASLGSLGTGFTEKLEEVKSSTEAAQKSSERVEQSTGDVLEVLKKMEVNHQRGLWIFASLIGILFVVLVCFAAKLSQVAVTTEPIKTSPKVESAPVSLDSQTASDSGAVILENEFQF